MARISLSTRKLSDLDSMIPGLSKVWAAIKAECRTSQRTPKSVTIADGPQAMMLDDGFLGRRFALDLATMTVSKGVHVSGGEWACHAGKNHDEGLQGVPNGTALIDCEWNDVHRSFSMRIQVAVGAMPAQMTA